MKVYRFLVLWGLVFLGTIPVAVSVKSEVAAKRAQKRTQRASSGERAQSNGAATLAAPVKAAPGPESGVLNLRAFEAAAAQNLQLQAGLGWSFGGKAQRGWMLYAPLIAELIGSEDNAAPSEFAERVSIWQRGKGIESDGVLDGGTWSQMVSWFQSQRIKGQPYVTSGDLITIPSSDCYDPERPEELRKADRESFAAYKRMFAAAAADASLSPELPSNARFLKIISAYRSREYQDQLRRQSPLSGRAGLAVNSPHSTGRALDLYVGGEPVNAKDENRALQTKTKTYRWLVKNASRFGFRPYFYEPWHWEYAGIDGETRRQRDRAN